MFLNHHHHHHHTGEEHDDESDFGDDDVPSRPSGGLLGNRHARMSRIDVDLHGHGDGGEDWEHVGLGQGPSAGGGGGLSAKAGIILVRPFPYFPGTKALMLTWKGIHNVFIVVPQFLVTGLSAVIFAIFDPAQPPPHTISPPPKSTEVVRTIAQEFGAVVGREEALGRDEGSNSVVYIFR